MAPKRSVITPEKQAEGRFLYEQTFTPMEDIAGLLGISRDTLRKRVKEWGWNRRAHDPYAARRGERPKTAPGGAATVQPPGYPAETSERLLRAERVQAVVERELTAIESILAAIGTPEPDDAERAARTVASLARTFREMLRLEAPPAPIESADDDVPRNIDDLRRELLRKMDALIAEQSDSAAGDS